MPQLDDDVRVSPGAVSRGGELPKPVLHKETVSPTAAVQDGGTRMGPQGNGRHKEGGCVSVSECSLVIHLILCIS